MCHKNRSGITKLGPLADTGMQYKWDNRRLDICRDKENTGVRFAFYVDGKQTIDVALSNSAAKALVTGLLDVYLQEVK